MPNIRTIPIDDVLNLWVRGKTAVEIARRIGEVNGSKFQARSIDQAVLIARKLGDPRATLRRKSTAKRT